MLPIMPVTPPNSLFWRVVHFPLTLLLIAFALVYLDQIVIFSLHRQLRDVPGIHDGWPGVALAVSIALFFVASYVVFVRLVERRPRVDEFDLSGWGRELGGGLLAGFLLFSSVVAVIALCGGYHIVGTHSLAVLLPVLAISITSGVTEEIMLRALFFRLVERTFGSWIALLCSAALFGAAHLGNPNATITAAVAIAFEAGIMLAALYMLTRRLWAAIGLHAAWNFTQGGIYGIAVSGMRQDGVIVPRVTGSTLLTGGDFGAEASLPAMIIATAFGIVLLVIAWRRGRFVAPFWMRPKSGT
ncbi:MAG: family intrarane metalloprotease [Sphingomonas bacterium]|nr:family intrarane metalloprotease [Sphingomonas bacterium]